MSATVTLHCDTAKCRATITSGQHNTHEFIRNAAASQQGWTSRTAIGLMTSFIYDYCKEHSNHV